jgi:protein-disulfide isomerase
MTQPPKIRQSMLPLHEQDHTIGSVGAAIVLMEYGDYQCSQSEQAHRLIQSLLQQLGEQLCFVFRHFPQNSRSLRAAESAEAAATQDKFWDMHNLLFDHQQCLEDSDLVQYADCLGLEIPRFLQAMAEHLHIPRIQIDMSSGEENGVEGTPTFFINIRHQGTQNLEVLLLAVLQLNQTPTSEV